MTGKTETEVSKLEDIFKKYEKVRGPLISLLQEAQKALGYLPPSALETISKETKIPLSQIYGIVTFYAQFHLEPHGRNTIRVCRGTACHVKGGKLVLKEIQKRLGIRDKETTKDFKFTLETVACLGTCALAPVAVVNQNYFGKMTSQKVGSLVKQYSSRRRK